MRANRNEYALGVSVSLFAFIVYVVTLCPSIDIIDAGELSTVAYRLGIAHPTGYPLFSLIGWLFTHALFPFRIIYRANLMAAFFCSAGLFFFFRFLVYTLREFSLSKTHKLVERSTSGEELYKLLIPAACGTLILAFSETYWSQATAVEVYSLHVFFLSTLLFSFSRAISTSSSDARKSQYLFLFAYILGLAFSNHMTTILLAPAFLFTYFYVSGFRAESWRRILKLAGPFLMGLTTYAFLVIRAGQHPIMNWGNPVSAERLLWHFTGKQYRVWLFSSTESAVRQFEYFRDSFMPEFGYLPLVLAVIGVWKLWKKGWPLTAFTAILFVSCVLYSINYDIHDIDSYFLLAYFAAAIWCAAGVAKVIEERMGYSKWLGIAALAISLVPLFYNYSNDDEHDFRMVENYSNDILKSVGSNGIVISYQWDYFVSAMNYLQFVEEVRPDVVVIDKELLRRSWYYVQLEKRYPWLVERSRPEIDAFLLELNKFEHDLPYDNSVIEYRYASLIKSFIAKNYHDHPVYVAPEIEESYTQGFQRVPSGLIFQIRTDSAWHENAMPEFTLNLPHRRTKYTDGIVNMYAKAYINNGIYLSLAGRKGPALALIDKALELDPAMPEASYWRDRLQNGARAR